jgi:sugar lactone lactonase YvrE
MSEHAGPPVRDQAAVYQPAPGWDGRPAGVSYAGDATSVAVDSSDTVFVFNRGPVPVVVLDRDGALVGSWGTGDFVAPHGIAIDADDMLYLVDSGGSYLGAGGHVVEKRTREGELLFQLGNRGSSAPAHSGRPFNGPTDIAIHPRTGELFVSDGYGNGAVHRYSGDGDHLASWGTTGTRPGQFNLPHGIALLDDDHLVVCDRENFRLQIFTLDGVFVDQWFTHHPGAVRRHGDRLYVTELGPVHYQWRVPGLGCVVRVLDLDGQEVTRFGNEAPGAGPDQFISPHSLAIDSRGDVYVAEVSHTWLRFVGEEIPDDHEVVSLRKWHAAEGR